MDEETFRALARSSRRLWTSVRLTSSSAHGDSVRMWAQRPDQVRVETLDGDVLCAESDVKSETAVSMLVGGGESPRPSDVPPKVQEIHDRAVALVADLVTPVPGESPHSVANRAWDEALRRRREYPRLLDGRLIADPPQARPDDAVPYYENYHWIALLEPDELADGRAPDDDDPPRVPWHEMTVDEQAISDAHDALDLAEGAAAIARGDMTRWVAPPARYESVREVEHHGRPAAEAVMTVLPSYDPRCSCCALLPGRHADELEFGVGAESPGGGAERFRVRVDLRTGICVEVETLDGADPKVAFTVVIEEVDVSYPPELFRGPLLGRIRRLVGPTPRR